MNPTVVHPTAAVQPPKNRRGAAPFLFFVLNVPRDFREFLVRTVVFEVEGPLKTLFFKNGVPVAHDYVVTLKNYNMRIDTDERKEEAKTYVRNSVISKLFDKESPVSGRIKAFLMVNRDNLPNSYTDEQVLRYVRDSVQVEAFEIIVPVRKILMLVYNVYMFPPTNDPRPLDKWRKWISQQRFYTEIYGIGEKYEYPFRCTHCKSTDHPGGLCPYAKGPGGGNGLDESDNEDDLLPRRGKPGQGPKPKPQELSRGKPVDRKGKGRETAPPAPRPSQPGPSRSREQNESGRTSKKRKMK